MLTKEIIPHKADDVLINMLLSQYKGFELNLNYNDDSLECVLSLKPISDTDRDLVTSYAFILRDNINATKDNAEQAFQCFKDDFYTFDDAVNEVIVATLESMKTRVINIIQSMLDETVNACPYCGLEAKQFELENPHGSVNLDGNKLVVSDYYDIKVKISYCPMCGRKLGSNQDEKDV